MVQVIYGDVLLLVDFCIDFFILYLTGIFLRRCTKTLCIAGAALVGGIYSVAEVFINGNDVLDFIISMSVGALMCYISFGGYKFIKTFLVFMVISAMCGGIMMAVFFFLGSYHFDMFGNMRGYAYTHIPLWLFALLALFSFAVSWMFSHIGRERAEKDTANVEIYRNGKSVKIRLLYDSGNLVKEPISGKYVIFAKMKAIKTLLSDSEISALSSGDSETLLKNRFRIVTAHGIDGNNKTYFAFHPERLLAEDRKKKCECDVYIAVSEADGVFGENEGIANPAIIN